MLTSYVPFSSFAPIVLILKVLMAQQDLDKPFTGGLGSYKLYVLVAYHIDCHLASGGRDRPSEILIR
jgi:DNA polymerase sigma